MIYQTNIEIEEYQYPYYLTDIAYGADIIRDVQTDNIIIIYDDKLEDKTIIRLINGIEGKSNLFKLPVFVTESIKNFNCLMDIINFTLKCGATKDSTLVAVGGGVLNDIVGLAASMIFRGIKLISIPTSVIAAADSTLSLKQAINSMHSKNSIGAYYMPYGVITIIDFFDSLSQREYKSGLVESIKNALCISPTSINLFMEAMKNGPQYTYDELGVIIKCAIEDKLKVLKNDMREDKEGLVLEYGHCIGHAIEMASEGKVNHGEGVAFGMLVMAHISSEQGYLHKDEADLHETLLQQIRIVANLKPVKQIPTSTIVEYMKYDNKRGYICSDESQYPMVMLKKLGSCCSEEGKGLVSIDERYIKSSIDFIKCKLLK